MRYTKTALVALSVAASTVACAKDATAPGPMVDRLAFSYSGTMSGTFSAAGAFDSTGARPWAGAWRIDGTPLLALAAASPRGDMTHDAVAIVVPRTTPGTATIATICPPEGCADLLATFGRNIGGNDFLQGCHIVSGMVTIATISDTRVTGSFTGTGLCFSNTVGETAFSVSDGVFDLPLLPGMSQVASSSDSRHGAVLAEPSGRAGPASREALGRGPRARAFRRHPAQAGAR